MFKLVVVAGKLRGQEFIVREGELVAGRDASCDIHLPVDGISKRHVSFSVSKDSLFVSDLNSSNGTFVNGKAIKTMTCKEGDKISLPEIVLQVVKIFEKKVIVKREVPKASRQSTDQELDDSDLLNDDVEPVDIKEKILYLFKHKIMSVVYTVNKEYEWRVVFGVLLAVFIVVVITLTISPVLKDSQNMLLNETSERGAAFADEIARHNTQALASKNLDAIDSNFLERQEGVVSYELFDMEGRIVRPLSKLNTYTSDTFSIHAKNKYLSRNVDINRVEKKKLEDGEIGIAKVISAPNPRTGQVDPVGIIAIHFAPVALSVEASKNRKSYLEALITSALVGVVFYAFIYYLTIRPIHEVRMQIELAMRGRKKMVENKSLFDEMNPMINSINALLQRVREFQAQQDGVSLEQNEEDTMYVNTLIEFLRGAQGPAIVLNSQKIIQKLNVEAEDLFGMRENVVTGQDLLDSCKNQGIAALLIELCDMSANNSGSSQENSAEIGGKNWKVFVTSLMGKDSFVKAFYITVVKES